MEKRTAGWHNRQWRCPHCGDTNFIAASNCKRCNTRRPTLTRNPRVG